MLVHTACQLSGTIEASLHHVCVAEGLVPGTSSITAVSQQPNLPPQPLTSS